MKPDEIFNELLTAIEPDFKAFDFEKDTARKTEWKQTVRLYLKRMLLLIDSRYSDKSENIRLVDAQNETPYYFSPDNLESIYRAATAIHEGKKRGSLLSFASLENKIMETYSNPPYRGLRIPLMENFSDHYRFTTGQLNIITGIPSHGKSEFLDQLLARLSFEHSLKFAIFSPENYPHEYHVIKLLSKLYNKPFFKEVSGIHQLSQSEIEMGMKHLDKHFVFLSPYENDVSLEAILSLVLEAKKEKDISAFVIDPWNEIEHNLPPNKTEVQYLSESLTKIRRFGRTHNITPFIVAHPTKLVPTKPGDPFPIPTAYNINGGAMWFNKADNILSVYRNQDDTVSVFIQKIKFKQFGKKGQVDFDYEQYTGTYKEK